MSSPLKPADATTQNRTLTLALIPVGIALNLAIGTLVSALKLPVFLDATGTIIVTLTCGLVPGIVTGVVSFLLGGILTNPVLPYFVGTQAAVAIYVYLVSKRGGFKTLPRIIFSGIGLGIVAGIISAPVIVYLFGGITGSGRSLLTAYLLSSGQQIINAVVLSGLASEPLDKTLQCLLVVWLLKGVPSGILRRFDSHLLRKNELVG